jgi:DNA repair exonuclease SbcCD nuclease subunit
MASRRPLRLLHTSDVHLGAYDSRGGDGVRRRELEDGFRRVIDLAVEEGADLLLIAGDFFDHARVFEETLRFAAGEIARFGRPTVIGPGNHDHVGPNSVYDRLDFAEHAPNLRILRDPDGERLAFPDLDLEVWGAAHTEQRAGYQPFSASHGRGEAGWQVGIGHGHFIGPNALLHHSFHIRAEHLAASEFDYVALGHWERLTRVEAGEGTVAAYSGAPDALSGNRDGHGGHVLVIDLCEDGSVRLEGVPVGEGPRIPHDDLPFLPAM